MTKEQWEEVVGEALGLWGTSLEDEMVARRLKIWVERWRMESLDVMLAALRLLERRSKRWPSVSEVHAALDEVRTSRQFRTAKQIEDNEEPVLTPEQRRIIARQVWTAAENAHSEFWKTYLRALSSFYEENAARQESGQELLWPPPAIPGHRVTTKQPVPIRSKQQQIGSKILGILLAMAAGIASCGTIPGLSHHFVFGRYRPLIEGNVSHYTQGEIL